MPRADQPVPVMPGLGPGIHVFATSQTPEGVDGLDKPGHDGEERLSRSATHLLALPHPWQFIA